jgi:hypothetical protein
MAKGIYGLPVFDAKRDLVLHITQNDIAGGKKADSDYCVAANALCRQEGFKTARVHKTMTYVYHKDGTVSRYVTPQSLYMEIMIYDRGGKMEAGDHILKAPKGSSRLGHHEKPRGPHKDKTGKLKRPAHLVPSVREDAPKGLKALKVLFGEA